MKFCKRIVNRGMVVVKRLSILFFILTAACDSPLVRETKNAEHGNKIISNEMMTEMYPKSFKAGTPPYMERDFEAGADFICDEIKMKYRRDLCSEQAIRWR